MTKPPIRSFRARNFKAIRDSGRIDFGWLTVFIGNNGVGKSSVLEAMETFRDVVLDGVDDAFQRWHGFEHVWNHATEHEPRELPDHRNGHTHPMAFALRWHGAGREWRLSQQITLGEGGNSVFIRREQATELTPERKRQWVRNDVGKTGFRANDQGRPEQHGLMTRLDDGESMLRHLAPPILGHWQSLVLNPEMMGGSKSQQRAKTIISLARDGSNLAEYLNDLRSQSVEAFDGLLGAVRTVLPYAADLQPTLTSVFERAFYLKMKEQEFEVPGWLLSTGTLRIVAILACLRHPKPPSLLMIEEIENGLDPSTLHLVVEEIRAATVAGTTQVIATTHSPYLLDLLDLSHIVVVERIDGQPTFKRPDEKELANWSKSFSPGRLYTMGRLTKAE